jgi:hypothetical protein
MLKILGVMLSWINPFFLISKVITYFKVRRFRNVFGKDSCKDFYVIYNVYNTPSLGIVFPKPKLRVQRGRCSGGTNLTTINSTATSRAMAHLVYGFAKSIGTAPRIASDVECDDRMDISFISIGGGTNCKSVDLLENDSNKFLDFGKASIINKTSGEEIIKAGSEPGFDHGFIIKIKPNNNKEKTWICCAGFAEWATSGAAWYLAHRWKEIYKWAKKLEFALIIKTKKGSDESTVLLHKFLKDEKKKN